MELREKKKKKIKMTKQTDLKGGDVSLKCLFGKVC